MHVVNPRESAKQRSTPLSRRHSLPVFCRCRRLRPGAGSASRRTRTTPKSSGGGRRGGQENGTQKVRNQACRARLQRVRGRCGATTAGGT